MLTFSQLSDRLGFSGGKGEFCLIETAETQQKQKHGPMRNWTWRSAVGLCIIILIIFFDVISTYTLEVLLDL